MDNLIDWKLELPLQERLTRRQAAACFVDKAPLILSAVLVWWFAVLSPNGEIVYSNHRDKATCETTRKAYARVRSLTVTTCQTLTTPQEEEKHHGWKS